MWEIVRHMVWFAIVATVASFSIFAVLGNFAIAGAQDQGPVQIRDVISPGAHHLSGMVLLTLSCDELSVQTLTVSTTSYQLIFESWQDPSIACIEDPTPREFKTTIYAPSLGVEFFATLDGKGLPIQLIPDLSASSTL